MISNMMVDVLIVGAGPAGATMALLLAKAGWSVAIVEKKQFPRRKVCGEFISATSLPLLNKLGIADFYIQQAGPLIKRVGLYASDAVLTAAMPSHDASIDHFGRAVFREQLDHELLTMAGRQGAMIYQPFEVKSVQFNNGIFTGTLVSDHKTNEISARRLIMANGSWEKGFGSIATHVHQPTDFLAFKSHFQGCTFDSDLMPLLVFPGGYGGLVHSGHETVTLSCCIRRDWLQGVRLQYPGIKAGDAVLHHIKSSVFGVRDAFAKAQPVGSWLSAGPIRPGIRNRYKDGTFFVGNCAGEAHPVIAEGISMAMQSAWLLSNLLISHQEDVIRGKQLDAIGREYAKQWATCFANRIYAASLFAKLAIQPRSVALLLPLLKRFPSLLTLGARLSGKVKQIVPSNVSTKSIANETENTI